MLAAFPFRGLPYGDPHPRPLVLFLLNAAPAADAQMDRSAVGLEDSGGMEELIGIPTLSQ